MVREGPPQPAPYPAEKMRDETMPRTWLRRAIIIGGLIAMAMVAFLLRLWG